jgi:hypothetical protein
MRLRLVPAEVLRSESGQKLPKSAHELRTAVSALQPWITEMEYKGIRYDVLQTANPTGWKWTVWLDERRTKTGVCFSRATAIIFAEHAIEKIMKRSGRRLAQVLKSLEARSGAH